MMKVQKVFRYYITNLLKSLKKRLYKYKTFKYYSNKIKTQI